MRILTYICVLMLCLLSPVVVASDTGPEQPAASPQKEATGLRPSYDLCLKAAGGVVPDIQNCIDAEYAYQDKCLNEVYKALMVRLNKDDQTKLRIEERKWIVHRNSYCAPDPDGGQGQHLEANDCSVEETVKRTSELEAR